MIIPQDAVRYMSAAMEMDMFYGMATPQERLQLFLSKLGVKSDQTSKFRLMGLKAFLQ
jgi:hypothetical protein